MVRAIETPPEGNLTIDVDSLAGALSRLNFQTKLSGSTLSSHRKGKLEVELKRALLFEQETHPGLPSPVS